jgi:hypothetical protein
VYLYPDTSVWFRNRNLAVGQRSELTSEALIYLLVTWAVRPGAVPETALEYLAHRFAHCVGETPN